MNHRILLPFLVLALFFLSSNLFGQQFFRTYEPPSAFNPINMAVDSNGHFLMLGITEVPGRREDLHVICTDRFGDTLWVNTYGTVDRELAFDVCSTADGGWAILGMRQIGSGFYNYLALRLDANGNQLWARVFGSTSYPLSLPRDYTEILEDKSGNLWILGYYNGGSTAEDILLARLDPSGTVDWFGHLGGPQTDAGYTLTPTQDGGIAIGGRTDSYGNPGRAYYAAKIDSAGGVVWTRSLPVPIAGKYFQFLAVQEMANGDFVYTGTHTTVNQGVEIPLVRLNAAGVLKWFRVFTFRVGGHDKGWSLDTLGTDIIIGGGHTIDAGFRPFYMIMDSSGNPIKSKIRLLPRFQKSYVNNMHPVPYGDSLYAFFGRFNIVSSQPLRSFLWVTDTVSPGLCDDVPRPIIEIPYSTTQFSGGTLTYLTGDSSISVIQQTVPVELALHCNNWGGCNVEAAFTFVSFRDPLCVGDAFSVTGVSVGGTQFEWYMDGVLFSTDPNLSQSFTPSDTGWHQIKLVVREGTCVDSLVRDYRVTPPPNPPLNVDGPNPFCTGDTIELRVQGNFLNLRWMPGLQTGNPLRVSQPGTYFAMVTDSNGCEGYSDTVNLGQLNLPNGLFSFQANGLSVQFTDSSTGAASWDWDFGDGNSAQSQNPQHTYSTAGTYWVCLRIWDTNGCEGWFCDSVTVQNLTSRKQMGIPLLKSFPIPARNQVTIEGTGMLKVKAFDLMGNQKAVQVLDQQPHKWVIDCSAWNEGIWILQVTTSSGLGRIKLVIARE